MRNVTIYSEHIPEAFNGMRIVQFSDVHIGSFVYTKKQLRKALHKINRLKPDLILFTGDIINEFAEELQGWENDFLYLYARWGKYAILGNHDYGDYFPWKSAKEKVENFSRVIDFFRQSGFTLLRNANKLVSIDGQHMAIVGVENYGKPPFARYGNLEKALEGIDAYPKILMSHDPLHWKTEVLGKKDDIFLTLSRHTYGMQFGVETNNWRWSPVQYFYPQWARLYSDNGQFLYVNRGLGHIGFMGRIGIWPEITVFTVQKK